MDDKPGWYCDKCGGHLADKPPEPEPRECEAAQVAHALNERREGYGCTIIVVAFFALLAWVAYLILAWPYNH